MVDRIQSRRRRIMRDFIIKELSAVDRPAQGHALATLMKRAEGEEQIDKDYYPGSPQAVAAEVNALSFDEVLAENEAREAAMQVKDNVWARWHALCRSFDTIAADDDISPAEKVSAMQQSLQQFIASLREQSKVIAESISKSLQAVPALAGLFKDEGEVPMTAAEKQQLAELQKKIEDLTAKAASDENKNDAKKMAEIQDAIKAISTEFGELSKKLEEQDAERAELVAKAGMSDDEKEYMSTLDKDAKAKFMGMSPEERKKAMKKSADADPVIYKSESTGEEYRKSDDPRLVKLAKQADEAEQIAKAEREARETAELTKRATEELKDFAGDTAAKVEVLRAMSKMDEGARKALEAMLKAGGKAVSAAFDTIGHKQGEIKKTAADFEKRVDEIMARDKISKVAALEKAEAEFPEEFAAFQETGAIVSRPVSRQ